MSDLAEDTVAKSTLSAPAASEMLAEFDLAKAFRTEWDERVERLRASGLIDCKMKLDVDRDTTTGSVVRTLDNVLRLREAGRLRPLTLSI